MADFWEVLEAHLPSFQSGFFVTLRLVVISFVIAMVVGIAIAGFRVAPVRALRSIGTVYVEAFRNVPLLVLIFIFFVGFRRAGVDVAAWTAGTASLGLYTAAYIAEAIRSGVFGVGRGQIEAALSLGFSYRSALTKIVLPQAMRTVIPPIGNLLIAMVKNSAVIGASILAVPDLLYRARSVNSQTFQTHEAFFWGAVGYLLLTVSTTVAVRYLEKRLAVRR